MGPSVDYLNHVRPVVVEIPEFAVVSLMSPPERILLENLVLLEIRSHAPSFVVGQSVPILEGEGNDQ